METTWNPVPCHLHTLSFFISSFASSASGKTENLRTLKQERCKAEMTKLKRRRVPSYLVHCPYSLLAVDCHLPSVALIKNEPLTWVSASTLSGEGRCCWYNRKSSPEGNNAEPGYRVWPQCYEPPRSMHPGQPSICQGPEPHPEEGLSDCPPYARAVAQEVPRVLGPRQRGKGH